MYSHRIPSSGNTLADSAAPVPYQKQAAMRSTLVCLT